MSYIGSTPTTQSFIAGTDYFNGDGSTVAFTLSRSVVSVNDIEVVINNVEQQPNSAYTVSGTTITFTSAPSAGTSNIYVRYLSTTTQSITPSQNTVSYSTLNSDNQSKLGISFKNRIINGAMVLDQRNGGATGTAIAYTVDRWQFASGLATKGTWGQNLNSVTPPAGFTNYLGFQSNSAYSVGSSDYFTFVQYIEGYNTADLGFGTANAKTITLSFWVYSSLTGTFSGSVRNSAADYTYVFSYSIPAANTWTLVSIPITGATSGTWLTTNGTGLAVFFSLGMGSTFTTTAGSWQAGTYAGATGAVNVVGTSGATFYLTGVSVEVGTQATTFDYRSYGTELALCSRYYQDFTDNGSNTYAGFFTGYVASGGYNISMYTSFPVSMRTAPTVTISGWAGGLNPSALAGKTGTALYYAAGSGGLYTFRTGTGAFNASAEL